MAHRAFNGGLESTGLLGTESQDHYFLSAEHGGHTHGEGLGGHLGRITVKETGIHLAGVLGKGYYAGAALQGRERLVEGNVAVFAHAAQEQVKTAGVHDGFS